MRSYPTDEELMKFIEEVEKEPLYVPKHLKEEMLKSLVKQDIISVHKLRKARIQMFTYSIKITAGMIAALFLVFLIPHIPMDYQWKAAVEHQHKMPEEKENRFETTLQKGTDAINHTSTIIFNKIMIINDLFEED